MIFFIFARAVAPLKWVRGVWEPPQQTTDIVDSVCLITILLSRKSLRLLKFRARSDVNLCQCLPSVQTNDVNGHTVTCNWSYLGERFTTADPVNASDRNAVIDLAIKTLRLLYYRAHQRRGHRCLWILIVRITAALSVASQRRLRVIMMRYQTVIIGIARLKRYFMAFEPIACTPTHTLARARVNRLIII